MSAPFVFELTQEEAETVWNAMEYAFEGLDSDMSLMDDESQAEIRKLEELKDRIKEQIDSQPDQSKYQNAMDAMFGNPMEALDNLSVREGRNGGE